MLNRDHHHLSELTEPESGGLHCSCRSKLIKSCTRNEKATLYFSLFCICIVHLHCTVSVLGWQTNHLDLAPQLAGILVAVTQCFSNIAGIFSPLVAGYFIQQSVSILNGNSNRSPNAARFLM